MCPSFDIRLDNGSTHHNNVSTQHAPTLVYLYGCPTCDVNACNHAATYYNLTVGVTLSVIVEYQQQEIAELKAQLGQQSSLAQFSFQSHSSDVSRPSPPPSVKPKKPEIFLEKAEDVETWIALWQNLYHIMKTPPEEQAPIAVTYLSLTLQVKLAEEARVERIPITSLEGLKEALYRTFPDPNIQETLRSEIRQICMKKGVWDYMDEFRGIARRLTDMA
uniref:Retrotransposon gag domain-containing protein n=1 Tax=Chromera velia CCMP2878 TaxID=1169474 RepID=A0A0G4HB98_9ALVE|eukprot:Cvel_25909.t1-p1 / transcript=Cvel_25909.t1 / gene=Cvel_25909 / organism=Chromera_velia_CCMP2878 / gene_product=hypothetical protein / transcript_product=hypothetical protein / location=Cvel_scaffold2994:8881-10013(+) / protein_length=218 / sequence_SO=supercontig / SO=protein_coding / is_pseudo=false